MCPHVASCELYQTFNLRGSAGIWNALYCRAGFERCARYKLAVEGRPIPAMLPNGKELGDATGAWQARVPGANLLDK
jgi:hypothetical protein